MFTGSRTGRLIAPKAGPDTSKTSPGDCARACADLPHTKCMSFNYDFGHATCELIEAIEGHDYKRSKSGLFEHYERLGVGKTKQFVYNDLRLQHNKLHYFNFWMVNVLAYKNIITSKGILVDLTTPLTGRCKVLMKLQHNKLHYFNFLMVNVLAYKNIITSKGILVDLTTPLTGRCLICLD